MPPAEAPSLFDALKGSASTGALPPMKSSMSAMLSGAHKNSAIAAEARDRELDDATRRHRSAKAAASKAWVDGRLDDCVAALSDAIEVNTRCDVLHRMRCRAHARRGSLAAALDDAGKAVMINPTGPSNFVCHALCLQQQGRYPEAGSSYLSALKLGEASDTAATGYTGLLETVRRGRKYSNLVRPHHLKVQAGGEVATGVGLWG